MYMIVLIREGGSIIGKTYDSRKDARNGLKWLRSNFATEFDFLLIRKQKGGGYKQVLHF